MKKISNKNIYFYRDILHKNKYLFCPQNWTIQKVKNMGFFLSFMCFAIRGTTICTKQYPQDLVSLVAYEAEDGLVGHQWEERPLVLQRLYALVQGNAMARKREWVGWGAGQGESIGDFGNNI